MLRTERPVIAAEKKAVIRRAAEEALDTRIEDLEHWLSCQPNARHFPTGHFADISQALGLIKTLDEIDAEADKRVWALNPCAADPFVPGAHFGYANIKGGPRPAGLTAPTAVQELRAFAERWGYAYNTTALADGVRVEVKKKPDAPKFFSSDVKRDTEEAAAEALLSIMRSYV